MSLKECKDRKWIVVVGPTKRVGKSMFDQKLINFSQMRNRL